MGASAEGQAAGGGARMALAECRDGLGPCGSPVGFSTSKEEPPTWTPAASPGARWGALVQAEPHEPATLNHQCSRLPRARGQEAFGTKP